MKKSLCMLIVFYIIHTLQGKVAYNLVSGLPEIYISNDTEKIGATWKDGNVWDKNLIGQFYSLLPRNDFFVVFDIGAQTGSFSLLAKYFPNSQWYTFEPLQEAVDALQENLTLNGIDNVTIFSQAVTDFSGKVTMKIPVNMAHWGLATIGSTLLRFNQFTEREVECIHLDSFIINNNIQKVHFIKLDTEGAELYILRGAQKMILRDHPIILMEYNETNMKQCNVTKHEIDVFLKEMGYAWKLVSHEDILCTPHDDVRMVGVAL